MINDSILNDLWAVMEDNPDNPDQLRVIADRYMEIHYGFEKFTNGLRWAADWNRVPLKKGNLNIKQAFYSWTPHTNSHIGKASRCIVPFIIESGSLKSVRDAYELLAFVFQIRSEDQIRVSQEILQEWQDRQLKPGDRVNSDSQGRAVRVRNGETGMGTVASVDEHGMVLVIPDHRPEQTMSIMSGVTDYLDTNEEQLPPTISWEDYQNYLRHQING